MKWHQRLFFKVFMATWLISVLLMGGLVYGLLRASETRHWQVLMETRATGHAQLVLERREQASLEPRRGEQERHRRFPMRIIHIESGDVIHDTRRPESHDEWHHIEWLAEDGQKYRLEIPQAEQPMHIDRMLRFLLSIQMVLILVVSTLVAVLVSIWVVKPVNRLKLFTQRLQVDNHLSSRTDTALSQRKDELGELARAFDEMAGHVEKTLQARQQLLRDVSHELRAPLARLQVATGILEQQSADMNAPLLHQINQESEQLTQLIDQLLSLSRLDDLALEVNEPIDLNHFVMRLKDKYQLLYPTHQILVETAPDKLEIRLNPALLERILGNVLENALKHSPENGLVTLTAVQNQQGLTVCVKDSGPGVDEEDLPAIFEPFYRGKSTKQGYGLGLSIVKNAVKRLNGEVSASNRAEGGLILQIKLPTDLR